MNWRYILWMVIVSAVLFVSSNIVKAQEEVGKWKRFEYAMTDTSWDGNPFHVELKGIFQSPSGKTLEQWGFYAGDNTWKLYFMPNETGTWSFETESSDDDLNTQTGTFRCVESQLPGMLTNDGPHWILTEEGGTMPVIWHPPVRDETRWGFRARAVNHPSVQETLELAAKTVGARVLGFDALLIVPTGWASGYTQSAVPYEIGEEGVRFHLPFWDQLNAKMDAARDLGMGHYIMFYSDDELKPDNFGLTPQSDREIRFFRYALARLACYPIVLWDSGIDISEYRSLDWIDWYTEWINENDPWQHPVGSRTGGGSGGKMPESATYYSTGGATLPSWRELVRSFWGLAIRREIPVAHTDHWRPFHTRGNWTHEKIRYAHWRCALAGGQALFPDYNQGDLNWDEVINPGAPWIGHATHFLREKLIVDLRELAPDDDWILAGDEAIASAKAGKEYVVYMEEGGDVEVDLTESTSNLVAQWYNPRTGEYKGPEIEIQNGDPNQFTSPTQGSGKDWVLHIHQIVTSLGDATLHNK